MGRDAVRRAEELKPDVAILDVAMPLLNGIEGHAADRDAIPGHPRPRPKDACGSTVCKPDPRSGRHAVSDEGFGGRKPG